MKTIDPRVQAALERHPEIAQMVREVDVSLLRWSLSLTPMERLRALSTSLRGIRSFKRVASDGR